MKSLKVSLKYPIASTVISYNSTSESGKPIKLATNEGGVFGSDKKLSGKLRTRLRSVIVPTMLSLPSASPVSAM